MTIRDALAAAIVARIGPARALSHAIVPWHSATFVGDVHHFLFERNSVDDLTVAAKDLAEDDIAIHSGFVADLRATIPDPARPAEVWVEALVVRG